MTREYSEYYICFFDLLGQKEFFEKIESSEVAPETRTNIERVASGLTESVKYVKCRYARLFDKDDDAGIELFSDSLLLSIRVRDEISGKLNEFLDIIVKLVFIACKYRLPFRGCITRGRAMRSDSGAIYGSAVVEAGELESKRVDYPRVLLSRELAHEFLRNEALGAYFTRDIDSSYILDYAGHKMMSRLEFEKEKKHLPEITEWVRERYQHYCFLNDKDHNQYANPILARKYVMWLDYLQNCT